MIVSQLQNKTVSRVLYGLSLLFLIAVITPLSAKSIVEWKARKFSSYEKRFVYEIFDTRYFFYQAEQGQALSLSFFPKNTVLLQGIAKDDLAATVVTVYIDGKPQQYSVKKRVKKSCKEYTVFEPIYLSLPIKYQTIKVTSNNNQCYFRVFEKVYTKTSSAIKVALVPDLFQEEILIENTKEDTFSPYYSANDDGIISFDVIGSKKITLYIRQFYGKKSLDKCSLKSNDKIIKTTKIPDKKSSKYRIKGSKKNVTIARKIILNTSEGKNKITIQGSKYNMVRILIPSDIE